MSEIYQSRGELTRKDIINAAYELFIKYGYHGTSMRAIASQANIALGGIYNHFASKEEIFVAVLDDFHPYHEILPILKCAAGETIEAFVKDAAESMITVLERRPEFLNLMFIEFVEFNHKHLSKLFENFLPDIVNLSKNFVERKGNLRPIPLPIVIRAFIGLIFAYHLSENAFQVYMPVEIRENSQEYLVDIFLHGIIKD
jgi:AcrR family transcriptional regulator